ncbi:disease resistance protein RPS2 [Spatholobus suberectus]|nr:disease resistance protein RPS2 [Spatholobus suberectus]
MPEKYDTGRFLAIRLKDFDIHSLKGIKMLFERVENLFLEELNIAPKEDNIVPDIFYRLNLKGFPFLKNLLIVNNSTIQSLIHPADRVGRLLPEKAFPKLESLCLYNLKKMDKICSCELSEPSFGKLKEIKINLCGQLESVFSISVVRLLTVLETIEVSECNSLKEIVPVETQSNTSEIKLLKLPELRSLKLQSLSEFIGFYPIPSREREEKELFHEKTLIMCVSLQVEALKLERMELSSIPIDKIWSDYSSKRSSFQNLTHLDVNGCSKLKYLMSFSIANSLVSLQSLFVSKCEMESIFPREQDSHQKMKVSGIFPKLKNIKLSSMKSLSEIWNSKLPSDSFSKLDTLIIEECDKLVNVFPRYIEAIFRNLCNLRVTNCRSMQAIFNILEPVGDVANLQDVHLEILPKLEHVWKLNEDREGILNLHNLQKIRVQKCHSLENIFPFSVATCLRNLEYLVVWDCSVLREIVAKREVANADAANLAASFNFPKLRIIKFFVLQRLTSFYPGAHKLFCPTLDDLSIRRCDNLEPFSKETVDAQRKPVLFPEEVINKLKSMQIESWHAESPNSYMTEGNHRRDNLEKLCLSGLKDTEILYSFLHRNPNLKSLSLSSSKAENLEVDKLT